MVSPIVRNHEGSSLSPTCGRTLWSDRHPKMKIVVLLLKLAPTFSMCAHVWPQELAAMRSRQLCVKGMQWTRRAGEGTAMGTGRSPQPRKPRFLGLCIEEGGSPCGDELKQIVDPRHFLNSVLEC